MPSLTAPEMRITDTTDGQYIGTVFSRDDNPIVLHGGIEIHVERTVSLPGGLRFVSSNYIIDAREV